MPIDMKCGYMPRAFDDPARLASDATRDLAGVNFDTIVGRGLSGALVIPMLAGALDKHWLIIRKPDDSTHSWQPAEGVLGERWIFVDDFIDTGSTLCATHEGVQNVYRDFGSCRNESAPPTFVGAWTYEDDSSCGVTGDSGFYLPNRLGY